MYIPLFLFLSAIVKLKKYHAQSVFHQVPNQIHPADLSVDINPPPFKKRNKEKKGDVELDKMLIRNLKHLKG